MALQLNSIPRIELKLNKPKERIIPLRIPQSRLSCVEDYQP
jgi:hypothetical protein